MKIMKKTLSVVLTVIMIVGILPMAHIADLDLSGLFGTKAEAAGSRVDHYSATAGVEYARRYALSYNKEWYFYESGGDCANFLSQALFAGGMSMNWRWHCCDSNSRAYCMTSEYTWIRANTLKNYLVDIGGTLIHNPRPSDFSLGDAVFYDWTGNGVMNHSAIVTAIDNGVPKVSAHSTPESQSKLDAHWTYGHDSSCCYLVKLYGALCDNDYARSYDIYRVSGNGSNVTGVYRASDWSKVDTLKRFIIRVPDPNPDGWTRFDYLGIDSYVNLGEMTKIGHWDKIQVSHLMGAWYTKQAATCTQKGIEERKCSRCGYTEQRETGLGGRHQNIIPATCLSPEYCTACGTIISQALGHAMGDWTYTKAPTCLEGGTEKRVCERCGYTEERDVDALGHNYEGTVSLAGCVTTGASYYECTRCGDIRYENASWSAYSVIDTADPIYAEFLNNPDLCRSRTEYRYKTKSTTTRTNTTGTAPEVSGYTLSGSSWVWNDYGSWSGWIEGTATGDDYRQVETKSEHTGYVIVSDTYRRAGNTYRYYTDFFLGGQEDGADAREAHGYTRAYFQWEKERTVPKSTINNATTVAPGAASPQSPVNFWGYNDTNKTGYWLPSYEGDSTYAIFFIRSNAYTDYYRYRDRTKQYTYNYYKWSDWSSWTTTPVTGNDNTLVETRTTYSFRQDALDHDWGDAVTVAPTCHEDGYTGKVCRRCGAKLILETIPALGDNWGEWKLISEEDGVRTYRHDCINFPDENGVCACGHYEIKSEYDCRYAPAETIEPTCTEEGYTLYRCTVHENASECEAQGSVYEYQGDKVPALGHEADNNWYVVTPATCEEDGLERCRCVRHDNGVTCNKVFDRVTEKTGHDYQLKESVPPTCTEPGYEYWECANNSEHNYTVTLEALGHDMGEEVHYLNGEISDDETACGEHKWVSECQRDGCDYKEERYQFIDHTFGEEQTIDPTCVADGIVYHTCENCGYYEEIRRIDALGHDFVHDDVRSYDATCTEDGLDAYTCSRCGVKDDDLIPATGHAVSPLDAGYESSDDKMELVSSVPNVCGGGTVDTYRCTHINNGERCDYTIVIGEANDHVLGDYIVTKEPTCTEPGYKHKECQNDGCAYRTEDERIEPLGHIPGEEYIEKASCTQRGARKIDCERCHQTLEEYDIYARNHDLSEWATVTDPTCETEGLERRYCLHTDETDEYLACTYEETRPIPALTHDFGEWTDTGDGENHSRECSRGDKTETEAHDWDDGVVTIQPTAEAAGEMTYTCEVCGAEKTEPIPAKGWTVTFTDDDGSDLGTQTGATLEEAKNKQDEPAKAADQQYTYTFDRWEQVSADENTGEAEFIAVYTETLNSYTVTFVDDDGAVLKTETVEYGSGATAPADPEKAPDDVNHYEFTGWDRDFSDITGDLTVTAVYSGEAHDPAENVITPAKCTEDGEKEIVCSECGKLLDTRPIPATGHDWGEWETVTEPTYDDEGLERQICRNDPSHINERVIPVLTPESKENENITVEKTADYDSAKGEATIRLHAESKGKTVKTKSVTPLDIVLVLDQSGSMRFEMDSDTFINNSATSRLANLKSAADSFINAIYTDGLKGADHRIAVVGFAMGGTQMSGRDVDGVTTTFGKFENTNILSLADPVTYDSTPANIGRMNAYYRDALVSVNADGSINPVLTNAIAGLQGKGATAADYGMMMACKVLEQNPDADGRRRVVVFMTDGEPTYSSGFNTATAANAIENARILKEVYGADVYSVGVFGAGISRQCEDFLKEVASGDDKFYLVADKDAFINSFKTIAKESTTVETAFDDVTLVDTVSVNFTLTTEQETALVASAVEKLGVDASDVNIIRREAGTTEIRISHIHPKQEVRGEDTYFTVDFDFTVSSNEKTIAGGEYDTNTDNAGVRIGDETEYENKFTPASVTVEPAEGVVYFNINGKPFHTVRIHTGETATAPTLTLEGAHTFSGWDIPDPITFENGKVELEATLTQGEYTVTWNYDGRTETADYSEGDVISVPKVSANAAGEMFDGWNAEVPVRMPARDLEFTATYKAHTHAYTETVTKKASCGVAGTKLFACECGHSYEEAIPALSHSYITFATEEQKKGVSSFSYVVCENCGNTLDMSFTYTATATVNGKETTYDFKLTDVNNVAVQPDGRIRISLVVPADLRSARQLNIYREEADGTRTNLNGSYNSRNALITFTTDHFSTYILEALSDCDVDGHKYILTQTAPTCVSAGYVTFTCSVCGDSYTEAGDKATGHSDPDGDGICNECGEKVNNGSGGSGSSAAKCKWCGKVHTGFFGKLIEFFHNILYFFAHLFGKR